MLSHQTFLAVGAAQGSPTIGTVQSAVPHIGTVQLPGAIATMVVTWLLLAFIGFVGRHFIPRIKKWDNWIRLGLGFVGFVGPLSTVPVINRLSGVLVTAIDVFVKGTGWHVAAVFGVSLISIGIVAFGAYIYFSNDHPKTKHLLVFAACTLPLLQLPWIATATAWYINHLGLPMWDGLLALYTWATTAIIPI